MKTNPLRISPACDTIMSKFAISFFNQHKRLLQEGIPYEKAQKHYHPSDVYVTPRVCLRRHFIWKREYCIQRYLKLSDRDRPQFYFLYF